jgi:agmatine deiminase
VTFRLPAEWEPQAGLMLTWPHDKTDWTTILDTVEPVFVEIARHVSQFQAVMIVCRDNEHRKHVTGLLEKTGSGCNNCYFYLAASNDSWARDHGPVTVLNNGAPELLDFTFNGWGNKYSADLDNQITSVLYNTHAFNDIPLKKIEFVLEGGSIETDGRGTLLTTASCLLSPQRNPGLTRNEIEDKLKEYLHVQRIIWLDNSPLQGDDTDGHIDTLVRFADAETMMYVASNNPVDPNYQSLTLMENKLKDIKQINGKPYHLIPLPSIIIKNDEGQHLPASYANFLITNDMVLVPAYSVRTDAEVTEIFKKCFADRKIISINCSALIQQLGSLHCITMHLPQGVI